MIGFSWEAGSNRLEATLTERLVSISEVWITSSKISLTGEKRKDKIVQKVKVDFYQILLESC